MICNGTITSEKILAEIGEVASAVFKEMSGQALTSRDQIIQFIQDPLDRKIKEVTERIRNHYADFFNTQPTDFHAVVVWSEEEPITVSMSPDMQKFLHYVDKQIL